jgi:4-hydroxybenzoate polyprenyltransferase
MRTFLGLNRASHFGPTLIVTSLSYFFAQLYWPPATSLLIAICFFSGQLLVGWSNDLIDYKDDLSHSRQNKPLVVGATTTQQLKTAIAINAPICVAINLFGPLGFIGGGLSLFAVAWALAYNLYFKFTLLSPLPYAVAFASLPSCMALSKSETPPTWMCLGGALFGMAAHFINVIKDMDADRASNIGGLPQRIGTKASIATAASLAIAGAATLFIFI